MLTVQSIGLNENRNKARGDNALCLLAKKIVLMYLSALELTEEVVK